MKDDALEKKIDDTVDRLYAEIKLVEERRIKLTALREGVTIWSVAEGWLHARIVHPSWF